MNLVYYPTWPYWLGLSVILLCSHLARAQDNPIVDFSAAQGIGVDVQNVQINNIRVENLNPETGESGVTYYSILFQFDPNSLSLVPIFTSEGCATLRIEVFDIISQTPLPFTNVTLNQITKVTDGNGAIEFNHLPAVQLEVTAAREGYIDFSQAVGMNCDSLNIMTIGLQPVDVETPPIEEEQEQSPVEESPPTDDRPADEQPALPPENPNPSLPALPDEGLTVDPLPVEPVPVPQPVEPPLDLEPELETEPLPDPIPEPVLPPPPQEIFIGVTWGENPRDLDVHLTGPVFDDERFHVYFAQQGSDVAALELNDRFSSGKPEGVRIFPPPDSDRLRPGMYSFTVHHFTGEGVLSASEAVVSLQIGAGEVLTFTPPNLENINWSGEGRDMWLVFELHVNDQGYVDVISKQEYHTNVLPRDVW